MKTKQWHSTIMLALALALTTDASVGQGFPSKPVRIVVPFPPGGSNDVVVRALSQPLSRALGQSVIVENRGGGNGVIAAEHVARAPADGYTVLNMGFTFMSVSALRKTLPYDALKDFAAVAGIGIQPYVLSVHPSLPARSVKELISLARSRPGQLVYATNGYGTGQHLSGELLKSMSKIDIKLVAFQGGAPSTIAVLGGHASILFSTIPPIAQHIPAGKLRALAVTSLLRSELLKEVPTMVESGLLGFDVTGAMGVIAPIATPKEAINRLSAGFMSALQLPEVKAGLNRDGFIVAPIGPSDYDAVIRTKMQQIQKIAREANIKLD